MSDESHSSSPSPIVDSSAASPSQVVPPEEPQNQSDWITYIQKYIDYYNSKYIAEAEGKIMKVVNEALSNKTKDLDDKYSELRIISDDLYKKHTETKNDRIRTIEIVSVFVALLTFVSAQVNIFKDQTLGAALGFELILLGSLVVFVLLVHFVSRSLILEDVGADKKYESKLAMQISLFITAVLLIGFGVYILQRDDTSKKIGQNDATMIVQPANNIIQRR